MLGKNLPKEIYFSKLSQLLEVPYNTTYLKSYFKKDELTPNKKPNTHFENHFHQFEVLAWLVIQKYNFLKIIIK